MFLLGHLGIGGRLGRPFTNTSSRPALLLGCVLPDLIDKPLYYGLVLLTGKHGSALGLISSTRTIGHSLLFALLCCAFVRGPRGWALFVGMLTHALLDLGGGGFNLVLERLHLVTPQPVSGPTELAAIFFPLLGPHFPISPFHTMGEQAQSLTSDYVLLGELIGAALLLWDWHAQVKKRRDENKEPAKR